MAEQFQGTDTTNVVTEQVVETNVWKSAMGVVDNVVKTVTKDLEEENALKGSLKAQKAIADRNSMDVEAADALYKKEYGDYESGQSDMTESEAKAYFTNVQSHALNVATKTHQKVVFNQINTKTALMMNEVHNADFIEEERLKQIADETGGKVADVRDAFLKNHGEYIRNKLVEASNDKEQYDLILEQERLFKQKLNTPKLFGSTSQGMRQKLAEENQKIKQTKSVIMKKFKGEAALRLNEFNITKDNFDVNSELKSPYNNKNYKEDLKLTYGDDPVKLAEADKKIKTNYNQAFIAQKNLLQFDGTKPIDVGLAAENKFYEKGAKDFINKKLDTLSKNIVENHSGATEFKNMVVANPTQGKKFTELLQNKLLSATSEQDVNNIVKQFDAYRNPENGISYKSLISDDMVSLVDGIKIISEQKGINYSEAKKLLIESEVDNNIDTNVEIDGSGFFIDKDLNDLDDATYGDFKRNVEYLLKRGIKLTPTELSNMYEKEKESVKIKEYEDENGNDVKTVINKKYTNPIDSIKDENGIPLRIKQEHVDDYVINIVKQNEGSEPTEITYITNKNGKVGARYKTLNGVTKYITLEDDLKKANKIYIDDKEYKKKLDDFDKKHIKGFTEKEINNFNEEEMNMYKELKLRELNFNSIPKKIITKYNPVTLINNLLDTTGNFMVDKFEGLGDYEMKIYDGFKNKVKLEEEMKKYKKYENGEIKEEEIQGNSIYEHNLLVKAIDKLYPSLTNKEKEELVFKGYVEGIPDVEALKGLDGQARMDMEEQIKTQENNVSKRKKMFEIFTKETFWEKLLN